MPPTSRRAYFLVVLLLLLTLPVSAAVADSLRAGGTDQAAAVGTSAASVPELRARYDAERAARRSEAALHRLQPEDRRRVLRIYVSAGITLALAAIFGLFYRNRRLHDRLREERNVARAMIDLEQRERIRISRELQESIGPMLVALRAGLSRGAAPEAPDSLALLDRTAAEVRGIAHNLIPEELNAGLLSALRVLCEKISTAGALQAFAEIAEPLRRRKFPISYELSLYRIIQEVLTGMIRHSGASIVRIRLEEERDFMLILLKDNGRGFDTARITDSEGRDWKNIAARVRLLKGRIRISNDRNQSNEVVIRVPLQS